MFNTLLDPMLLAVQYACINDAQNFLASKYEIYRYNVVTIVYKESLTNTLLAI